MEGLFAQLLTTAFLATFIRSVVPLLLTGLGGLFSERSGVVNIALDGLIIFGALAGAVATLGIENLGGLNLAPYIGLLVGALWFAQIAGRQEHERYFASALAFSLGLIIVILNLISFNPIGLLAGGVVVGGGLILRLFSRPGGISTLVIDLVAALLVGAGTAFGLRELLFVDGLGSLAPWIGWLAGAIVGGLIAWIHAVISIKYRADQVISGTAINLLATGVPAVILTALYGTSTESPKVAHPLPLWGVGELRFSPPVYFAFLLVAITWYVLYRTPYGLRLRATGEHPGAAASMGVNVARMRYSGVILSGLLAGTAGVFLSIGNLDSYVRNISAGLGFIALAALIFGQWKPLGVLGATVLFGFLQAISITLGSTDLLPPTLVTALPYLITIIALIFTGRSAAPKALGKPFEG